MKECYFAMCCATRHWWNGKEFVGSLAQAQPLSAMMLIAVQNTYATAIIVKIAY